MSNWLLFVGEKPSPRAVQMGVDWTSGRLSAKNLHEALIGAGIDPKTCSFINVYGDDPTAPEVPDPSNMLKIMEYRDRGGTVIALGNKVSRTLSIYEIAHKKLTHPAARGTIRKTENYMAHVKEVLG
jgi:hypothetical protein